MIPHITIRPAGDLAQATTEILARAAADPLIIAVDRGPQGHLLLFCATAEAAAAARAQVEAGAAGAGLCSLQADGEGLHLDRAGSSSSHRQMVAFAGWILDRFAPCRVYDGESGEDLSAPAARDPNVLWGAPVEGSGVPRSLPLNLPEFPLLVKYARLPAPSILSPLPDLCAPAAKGTPRPLKEVVAPLADQPAEVVRDALLPLALPDRIVDVHTALFNSAPALTRLYGSRRADGRFVSLRHGAGFDRELTFPYNAADVVAWLYLQLQFASPLTLPVPRAEFSAEELAFFLAAVDACKAAFAGSFASRRADPEPVTVGVDDILAAATAARQVRDRRWIGTALGELLGATVHIGGRDGVLLPAVTPELARREVKRCVDAGHMTVVPGRLEGRYELGPRWAQAAGDLFTWLSLISMHDLQVTGGSAARPEAWEEILIFICTANTTWVLASAGLGACGQDLRGVRFGLASCGLPVALEVAAEFLKPWPGVTLAADFYGPATASAAAGAAAAQTPSPRPAPARRACPTCGRPVPADRAFCQQCGTRLGAPVSTPPGAAPIVCPACGTRAEPGRRFCTGCGAPLTPPGGRVH